jgi:hypothetical protein
MLEAMSDGDTGQLMNFFNLLAQQIGGQTP